MAAGDPTQPVMAVAAGLPIVAFQSTGNFTGANSEGNSEIWQGSVPFALPVVRLYCSTPGVAIPDDDPGGVTDTLTVVDPGTLADLDVSVAVSHTYTGDLVVTLVHHTTGVAVTLIDRPGSPPGFGCSGDDIAATLDDEAATAVDSQCTIPGPVAIDGSFIPNGVLGDFDGEDLAGDWSLTAADLVGGDAGTLDEWCLIATEAP